MCDKDCWHCLEFKWTVSEPEDSFRYSRRLCDAREAADATRLSLPYTVVGRVCGALNRSRDDLGQRLSSDQQPRDPPTTDDQQALTCTQYVCCLMIIRSDSYKYCESNGADSRHTDSAMKP